VILERHVDATIQGEKAYPLRQREGRRLTVVVLTGRSKWVVSASIVPSAASV
jgi:hypothetical protein